MWLKEAQVKEAIKFGLIPFGLGLGAAVAYRLSAEAMAVVVGVITAVIACTVMGLVTLVIVRAAGQRAATEPARQGQFPQNQYPQVLVIQPGMPNQLPHQQLGAPASYPWPAQRAFSVIGDDETRTDEAPHRLSW